MLEIERDYKDNTRGIAVGGLTTGIIGSALSLLNGGAGNILGGWGNNCNNVCSESIPVNRYELAMQRDLTNKDMEIAYLKGREAAKSDSIELYRYVDGKFAAVERELADQRTFNATQIGTISCIQGQIAQLYGLTKLVVPNSSVCPGWTTTTTGA